MIVRNEEDCLARCLKSVEGVVDEIIIVDTGSTDRTMEIAHQFGARLYQMPWAGDFAEARNASLSKARGEWILVLDADEELDPSSRELLLVTISEPDLDGVISTLTDCNSNSGMTTAQVCRLFRNRPGYRFEGMIHEQILKNIFIKDGKVDRKEINIFHYGYQKQHVKNKFKRARNISLLEGIIADGKADHLTYYHLGREYQRLEDFQRAIALYQRSFKICPALENTNTHDLLRRLADCLIDNNQTDEAFKVIKLAQEAYPDFTDLFLVEAKLHHKQKAWEQAKECLHRCLELGAPPFQYISLEGVGSHLALKLLGDIANAERKYKEAIEFYQQALSSSPSQKRLVTRIVELKIIIEGLNVAFDFVEKNRFLDNKDLAQVIAGIFAKHKAFDFALKSLEGIAADKLSLDSIQIVVYCYVHCGNFSLAAELSCHLLDTKFEELALTAQCLASIQKNMFSKAQDLARRLLEINPSNDGFWVLNKLMSVLNEEEVIFENRVINQGQVQDIVEFIIRIGSLEVSHVLVLNVLNKMLSSAEITLVLGKVWFNLGEFKEAAELLIQSYNDGAYDSQSLKMLGNIAEKEGFKEEAYMFYKEGLSIC